MPAYRLLTLMDAEPGASDGVAACAARQQEIAGTDKEIAVLVAQESLPVDADLELWSGPTHGAAARRLVQPGAVDPRLSER